MRNIFTFCIILMPFFSTAQQISIKGSVHDTSNNRNPANSVIAILGKKDSVLVAFTRTDASGKFELKNLKAGDYILMVTHPSFAEYVDKLNLAADKDLGKIYLIEKAKLMKEIIIRQQVAAIRQRGDTTEYIADSFKVEANASVEDLLKKMPGIQVDKDGKITSQGKTVEKVLVDGEEFFSDDPTVATRNLKADAIDKVQSFDKKK